MKYDTDALRDIKRRLEAGEIDREIEWTIAFQIGLGTEKEREFFKEWGVRGFTEKRPEDGFTHWEKHIGYHYKHSRPGREGRRIRTAPTISMPVTGPLPLYQCPPWTTSLDAVDALREQVLPGWRWVCRRGERAATAIIENDLSKGFGMAPTPAAAYLCAIISVLIEQEDAG